MTAPHAKNSTRQKNATEENAICLGAAAVYPYFKSGRRLRPDQESADEMFPRAKRVILTSLFGDKLDEATLRRRMETPPPSVLFI